METYYCTTTNGKELFLIPWVLAGRESKNGMRYYYDVNMLERLNLSIKEGRINKYSLECKGWEVSELEIPDIYIREFRKVCFQRRKKEIKEYADEIYIVISELVEELENRSDDYEDDGDYTDDRWGKAGEAPWE